MSITQLVYVSEETAALDPSELLQLVENARKHNLASGVTGVLLRSSRRFAQCLEGDAATVDALFQRIRADSRHTNIVTLQDVRVPSRCFGEWSMGLVSVGDAELQKLRSADWEAAMSAHADRSWLSSGFVLMQSLWHHYRTIAQ